MRILIVSVFFPPMNSIASHRPYSWAKYWTLEGHDVTVLTTPKPHDCQQDLSFINPGYRLLEVAPPNFINTLKSNYHQLQKPAAIAEKPHKSHPVKKLILDFYHYLRHQKGIFNACRMPDLMDLWIAPATQALSKMGQQFDLVVSTAGPYAVHLIASKMKKQGLAKKWIADFRDLWTDNHAFPGIFPFNKIEGWVEKRALLSADALTIVSPVWALNLAARHGEERVHVIENGFDPEDLDHLSEGPTFPQDGKYRLVHTGKVYPGKQVPELLFEALRKLKENPETSELSNKLEVLFAGPNLESIEQLTKKYKVEDTVKLLGFVSRDHCLAMQRDAHAALFLPWCESTGTGIGLVSGKIYEYLFSGTPILALGSQKEQTAQQLILETGTGEVVHSVDEVFHYLIMNLRNIEKKPANKTAQLEKYTRKHLASKLLTLIS